MRIMKNKNLCKLLYYTDRDALDRFEIARNGSAEIESVKVRGGRLYLEFHSGNARKDKGVVTSVFQYDLPEELKQ